MCNNPAQENDRRETPVLPASLMPLLLNEQPGRQGGEKNPAPARHGAQEDAGHREDRRVAGHERGQIQDLAIA